MTDLPRTFHNALPCKIRSSPTNPKRGTCTFHAVPVYSDGLDWRTDFSTARKSW